jgi:hypothetical protein
MTQAVINELDEKIRLLRSELDGVRGAVLRQTDPVAYQRKEQEMKTAMHEYYSMFYGNRVSMP